MNEEEQPVKDVVLDSAGQPEVEEKLIGVSDLTSFNSTSFRSDYET